jgi:hypothetical protein
MMLPAWLDLEAWAGWIEMRKAMKRVPFTERAQRIAMRQLEGWHAQGYDVNYILDEATLKGWRGLFINERTPRTKPQTQPTNLLYAQNIENRLKRARLLGVDVDSVH